MFILHTYTLRFLEQRESLEEENRQVHNTNNATITRLQELENTGSQLQVNQLDFLDRNITIFCSCLEFRSIME